MEAFVYKNFILQNDMQIFFRFILEKIVQHTKYTKPNSKFTHTENFKIFAIKTMGLVVDEEDINELLEEHKRELKTKLEAMKVKMVQKQFFFGEEEEDRSTTTTKTEIKETLS